MTDTTLPGLDEQIATLLGVEDGSQDPVFISDPSTVGWNLSAIQPDGSSYITVGDKMVWTVWNSLPNVTYFLGIRYLLADGKIQYSLYQQRPSFTRSPNSINITLPECFLLSVDVSSNGQGFAPNLNYTKLSIARGVNSSAPIMSTLFNGYIGENTAPFYPGYYSSSPLSDNGITRPFGLATPGLGASIIYTPTINTLTRIESFLFGLLCDATVGNRQVLVQVQQSAETVFATVAIDVQVASELNVYSLCSAGAEHGDRGGAQVLLLPENLRLTINGQIIISAIGMQPGDQFTDSNLVIEEWLNV